MAAIRAAAARAAHDRHNMTMVNSTIAANDSLLRPIVGTSVEVVVSNPEKLQLIPKAPPQAEFLRTALMKIPMLEGVNLHQMQTNRGHTSPRATGQRLLRQGAPNDRLYIIGAER